MSKRTLTDRFLKSLKSARPGQRVLISDGVVPGFAIRVTDKGTKTFVLVARFPGSSNPVPRALGEYGAITLEAARAKSRLWLELLSKGIDPKREAEREKLEQQRHQRNSFAAVAEDFIRRDVAQKRRGADMERELRREFIARWGNRPITEISQHDVLAVLDEAVDRGAPYQAHALFGHVRRLFNWAINRGSYGLTGSPCDRLKPKDAIGRRGARNRVLSDDEFRVLWRASGRLGYPFGPMYQMLALSGLRLTEVADARWRELNLKQSVWTIPAERMKGGAAHVVPLTPEIKALLSTLPCFDRGDHVFTTTFGRRPVSGFSKAKARLDRRMARTWAALGRIEHQKREPLVPWRTHDIRRSVRTHLSALPVPEIVRKLVLAHAKPGLHKVYDQYTYLDEKRRCQELWERRFMSIVTAPPETVVALLPKSHVEAKWPGADVPSARA